jgi:hypothetical protein
VAGVKIFYNLTFPVFLLLDLTSYLCSGFPASQPLLILSPSPLFWGQCSCPPQLYLAFCPVCVCVCVCVLLFPGSFCCAGHSFLP